MKKALQKYNRNIWFAFLAFLVSSISTVALALPQQPKHYIAPSFIGVRPVAMGEAFTAIADDQNALYYNPAGLARLSGWSLEVFSFTLGANTNLTKNVSDVMGNTADAGGSKPSEMLELFEDHFGKNNHFRFSLNPTFVRKNFGVGLMLNQEMNMSLHPVNPSLLDLDSTTDADLRVSGALNFIENKLSLGATVFARNRYFVGDELEYSDADTFIKDKDNLQKNLEALMQSGLGFGADFGLLFSPVETWKPTFGLSVLNIGDVKFRKSPLKAGSGTPEPLPQSINTGFSVTPKYGMWTIRAAVDFREINLATPAVQKLSVGMEGAWRNIIRVQAGMKELAFTAGAELRLFVLNVRYATYATQKSYFERRGLERHHLFGIKILL